MLPAFKNANRQSAERRNEAVRKVLERTKNGGAPMTPSEIARAIGESWCWQNDGEFAKTNVVSPILKRIGAKSVGGGRWTL